MPATAGQRRTRGRRRRAYERRRRTRRLQHGGDTALSTWLTSAAAIRTETPSTRDLPFSALKREGLTLQPGAGPKFEKYLPSSFGDIITSIAVKLETPIQTSTQFVGIMTLLSSQEPDVYQMLTQLERDLEIEHSRSSAEPAGALPDLTNPEPKSLPFLWIAYANLDATAAQLAEPTPVLIQQKSLSEEEPTAPVTTVETASA